MTVGGWSAQQVHEAVLTAFQLSAARYGRNQLRYDLRKDESAWPDCAGWQTARLPAHRQGHEGRLTFVLFHNQLCGPLANSLFHHHPHNHARPNSKLEAAYHKADASIRNILQLLEAA